MWEGSGTDAHARFHTLTLTTLPVTSIFSFRELREDCGVDPARVKHLQRLEAKRGTISAFFAKQVTSPLTACRRLHFRQQAPTATLLTYNDSRLSTNRSFFFR